MPRPAHVTPPGDPPDVPPDTGRAENDAQLDPKRPEPICRLAAAARQAVTEVQNWTVCVRKPELCR